MATLTKLPPTMQLLAGSNPTQPAEGKNSSAQAWVWVNPRYREASGWTSPETYRAGMPSTRASPIIRCVKS